MLACVSDKPKRQVKALMVQDNTDKHRSFMRMAMDQAQKAYDAEEVPIGAILVDTERGIVLATSHNQTITQCDPTAHAEILALRDGCRQKNAQRIPNCDLYVTLEPCPMCAAAISFARIRHVYFGADDPKSGGFISGPGLVNQDALHHKPSYTGGILAEESAALLRKFFQERR
jgi:tRNA(adenine34) deaminase